MTLTGTSHLYDLVRERTLTGTVERPLVVPPDAVIVPGTRALRSPSRWTTAYRSGPPS